MKTDNLKTLAEFKDEFYGKTGIGFSRYSSE